jgi:hypothetical protein
MIGLSVDVVGGAERMKQLNAAIAKESALEARRQEELTEIAGWLEHAGYSRLVARKTAIRIHGGRDRALAAAERRKLYLARKGAVA